MDWIGAQNGCALLDGVVSAAECADDLKPARVVLFAVFGQAMQQVKSKAIGALDALVGGWGESLKG